MSVGERSHFLECYDSQRSVLFDNKRVLLFCQGDVSVLRVECQAFRREFLQFGNTEFFKKLLKSRPREIRYYSKFS